MSTLSTGYRSAFEPGTLRAVNHPIASGLKRQFAVLTAWLDDLQDRRRRNEHERFLAKATDPYELERRERKWERGRLDAWRIL